MWDKKRKLIWIAGGLLMGTYVAYSNSITDDGEFSLSFFIWCVALRASKRWPQGRPLPAGFRYASDTNPEQLTPGALTRLLGPLA